MSEVAASLVDEKLGLHVVPKTKVRKNNCDAVKVMLHCMPVSQAYRGRC